MPLYEYKCADCDHLTTVLIRRQSDRTKNKACASCGSMNLSQVISKLGRLKSAQDVIDEKGAPSAGREYEDPRQIGAWVEKRFEDYGMPIPEDTRNMIDAAREGELPKEISDI
tara:strand:+ start:1727 stop:2065 length:339 start_codon:yes stop_codon:yes gene_type:complete